MNQVEFIEALLATGSVGTVQSQVWPKSIPADNMSGFSALPGGKGVTLGQLINGSNFVHLDSIAFFWFTEEANRAMGRSLRITNNSYEHLNDTSNKTTPLSVRCVRELDD
jgi:uncharacterized protein (TIGR02145 family)